MQGLLIKKIHLEDAMAWLSTFGDAFHKNLTPKPCLDKEMPYLGLMC